MTPSDDLSPPRRPIFFPVVIATVFLTIIGLTVGYILGEQRTEQSANSGEQRTPTEVTEYPSTEPINLECPAETVRTAERLGFSGDLRQVFKIATNNGTVVWICEDPAGELYYQGKTGGVDSSFEEDNSLFLSNVKETGDRSFSVVAPNDGNEIRVDTKQLRIDHRNGRRERYDVIRVG